jgi:hypothetical protein
LKTECLGSNGGIEQFNGREGETATLLMSQKRSFVGLNHSPLRNTSMFNEVVFQNLFQKQNIKINGLD